MRTIRIDAGQRAVGESSSRNRQFAYWFATLLAAVAFAIPGVLNLAHAPHVAGDMAHLGYPSYFSTILGTWKLLAVVAILAPRTARVKEWAYAGMIFDLTGAATSRFIVGDGLVTMAIPLMIAGVVVVSWRLRPSTRRLAASGADSTWFAGTAPSDSATGLGGVVRGGANA